MQEEQETHRVTKSRHWTALVEGHWCSQKLQPEGPTASNPISLCNPFCTPARESSQPLSRTSWCVWALKLVETEENLPEPPSQLGSLVTRVIIGVQHWQDLPRVSGISSSSGGFTQPKWGNRGKTKPNKQECTCETMYMVEISSVWTQHRGTKATKGEKGYFITVAGPPSHWSLSLHMHSPTSTYVVPMQNNYTKRQNSLFLMGLMLCRQVEHTGASGKQDDSWFL